MGVYYTPKAAHQSQTSLVISFVDYVKDRIVKEYTGDNRGLPLFRKHCCAFDGLMEFDSLYVKGLTGKFAPNKDGTCEKDYHKFFFGDYTGIWGTGSHFCIGLNKAHQLGINYKAWPNGRHIIKDLYTTAGNVAKQWKRLPNNSDYAKIWNCVQVNIGYNTRTRNNIWAPQFHLDDQVLYTPNIKGDKVYSGIISLTLQGSNAICWNKRYWFSTFTDTEYKDLQCSTKIFQQNSNIWAKRLLDWGIAKQPGSIYGLH